MADNTTLVIGGTGKTGSRVARRLTDRGLPVRVGSRSGEPPFNWEDPATWEAALDGVTSVYIAYYPDVAFPGAAESIGDLARLAVDKGARRLVLLSARGSEGAELSERAVRDSGADWTVVRASWFHQNFNESFLLEPVLGGEIALPTGDAVEPWVDADDVADVAVAALTNPGHEGKIYELSGPRLLSFHDIAAELSNATNREIHYVPITMADFQAVLRENGLPVELSELFGLIADGRNGHLVDGVQQVLGRAPRDFRDFVREAAATGVWNP